MQLKWLVVIVVVGVQTLTAAVVAVAAWFVVTGAVEGYTERTTRVVADTVRLRYERFVDPATDAVDLARFLLQRHGQVDISLETFERFMFDQLGEQPVVDALYLGRSSGEFLMVKRVRAPGPPSFLVKSISIDETDRRVEFRLRDRNFSLLRRWRDDDDPFDPRTRPWFRAAREQALTGERRWTEPYVFFTSGAPGVSTANAVIGDAQDDWGAVSVDIETGSFSTFLAGLSLPGDGEAFIADWRGEVVALPSEFGAVGDALFATAHGDERPAILASLDLSHPDVLREAQGGTVVRDVSVGGRDFIVQLLGFENAGMPWSIVIAVPQDAVFEWIYRLRDTIVAISAIAAALAVAVLLIFWRGTIELPLTTIAKRLGAVARGESGVGTGVGAALAGPAELRAIDEAVTVAGSMISEREAARVALIERLSELVEAMEQAPVGIVILKVDRRVDFSNRLARETFSIPAASEGEVDPDVLGMSPQEFAAKIDLVASGRTVRSETVSPPATGEPAGGETSVEFGVVLSPLGDAAAPDARVLMVLEDVSTAKSLEAGLVRAREAAEESDQAKTLFLAQMSHEFRTPLNAIVGFSDILRATGASRPDRVTEYAGDIFDSASVLLDMIERILEYARFESGEAVTPARPTDVEAVLHGAAEAVRPAAEAKGVTIEIDVLGTLEPVAGDAGLLGRALEQLLSNAVKFSASGSSVSVAAAQRSSGGPGGVTIGIVDRGPGINVADLSRVFEPFWKGPSHLRAEGAGPGLGLSIARRIVEGFGGNVEIDSAAGEGTRVVMVLPAFSGPENRASNDGD